MFSEVESQVTFSEVLHHHRNTCIPFCVDSNKISSSIRLKIYSHIESSKLNTDF